MNYGLDTGLGFGADVNIKYLFGKRNCWYGLGLSLALLVPCGAFATPTGNSNPAAANLADMFEYGHVDGELGVLYYANHNAFFSGPPYENGSTATAGGELGFTTATLNGFSLRFSAFAQRNFSKSSNGADRDLKDDREALGEAWLQWQGYGLRVRAGNQELHAPFTGTYDYRIIPQTYQGVSARYGGNDNHITLMRVYRYKSRISESYERTTNYNKTFDPFSSVTEETDGFWALGAAGSLNTESAKLSGKAWFFNYVDYANLYYLEGRVAAAYGAIKPFLGVQYARETDEGDALLGPVDSEVYGIRLGLTHKSLTATLNYDYIPHESGAYLNGALVTPYAHAESSGPFFAQPFLTSTQDLGSGSAYSVEISGAPLDHTILGARYSYMDLTPVAGSDSIKQSEYLVYAIYNFSGPLTGLSVTDFFAYQTQNRASEPYWENRLAIQYRF